MMFEMKATEQYRLMWCCLFQMVLNIESSVYKILKRDKETKPITSTFLWCYFIMLHEVV